MSALIEMSSEELAERVQAQVSEIDALSYRTDRIGLRRERAAALAYALELKFMEAHDPGDIELGSFERKQVICIVAGITHELEEIDRLCCDELYESKAGAD